MFHPLKITSTLADETRYFIYEYMLQHKKPFTVTQIAEQFQIHPNVARLHLTKLAEIQVITADYAKTGKGGRPGRVYKAASDGITLSFPKREEPLILNWALQLIEQLGESAITMIKKISFDDGYNSMKTLLLASGHTTLTIAEKCAILTKSAALIGYVANIQEEAQYTKIIFSIYNCPFKNQIDTFSTITCTLHESYIQGQMEALFSPTDFVQMESMIHNCDFCNYEVSVPK